MLRPALFSAAGVVGGTWLFVSAFKKLRLRRAVQDTPLARVRSAALGRDEFAGRALPAAQPLRGPFSGLPCVWYRWKVEEERRDSKGNVHWTTLGQGESFEAFALDDGTGSLRVEPRGAEVEPTDPLVYRTGGVLGAGLPPGPAAAEWASAGIFASRRRLSEWTVAPDTSVFAVGVLRSLADPATGTELKVLMQGTQGEPFFISSRSRAEVERELAWSVWLRMAGGALLAVASAAVGMAALGG